jgi:hypothetical protein
MSARVRSPRRSPRRCAESGLEIIAVLNENARTHRRWQNARLEECGLMAHPRVGLFAL